MKTISFITGLLLLIMSLSLSASVDKIDSIREAAVSAYNTKNIEKLMSFWHKNGKMLGAETIEGYSQIKANYIDSFSDNHFFKITMSSEGIEGIGDIFYDTGKMSILDDNGENLMTGCYVLLYVKSGNSFKTWREWFYPECLNTTHH